MKTCAGMAGVLLCLSCLAPAAGAAELLVPDAYATIQEAMDVAVAGDQVVVAAGVYDEFDITMPSDVTLRGAGMGETIIDAGQQGRCINLGSVTGCEITDVTLRNADDEAEGTAVLLHDAQATLRRVAMIENLYGAIAIVDTSEADLYDCVMDNNAGKSGAGLDVAAASSVYAYGCQITNNEGPTIGGIKIEGDAVLEHCRIDGNMATGLVGIAGGGVGVKSLGNATLRFCQITNNSSGGSGGGFWIASEDASALLEDCLITGNWCEGTYDGGGGLHSASLAALTLRRCVIAGNYTTGEFSGPGGVLVDFGGLEMENCTLYDNYSGATEPLAGQLSLFPSGAPFVTYVNVTHSIIAASSAGAGVVCEGNESQVDISCSDVWGNAGGDAVCGVGADNFSADPLLCDPAAGNFHLETASPCAPGNHPGGAGTCGDALIGAKIVGCTADIGTDPQPGHRLLQGNQPNPFADATLISFALEAPADVRLEVIDPSGRRVALLQDGSLTAGQHHISWDGNRLDGSRAPSGVYFYRLEAGGVQEAMRMLRLR